MNKLEIEINRLGGMKYIFPDEKTSLSQTQIHDLERTFMCELPNEFKLSLLKYGIWTFIDLVAFDSISEKAEYEYPAESGIVSNTFSTSTIAAFLGGNHNSYNIFNYLNLYKDRIPDFFLPIASDGMGNLILLSLEKKRFGKIYFWNHENEWDEDDFEEDMGYPMPPEVKLQNVWLIGENFIDFMRHCYKK